MRAHEGRVLVAERDVELGAGTAALLRGGDQRRALAQRLAHRRAHLRMQKRGGVLHFAVLADQRRLAVTLRLRALDAERRDRALAEQLAEFLPGLDQRREVLDIAAGERIVDHGERGGAPHRRRNLAAHLGQRLVDHRHDLADFEAHRSPSCPLISEALRPPTRAWTRGPVVITSASRISSARGASATPISNASKWLRT